MQMVGDLAGLQALRGLSATILASPAPKVFAAVPGASRRTRRGSSSSGTTAPDAATRSRSRARSPRAFAAPTQSYAAASAAPVRLYTSLESSRRGRPARCASPSSRSRHGKGRTHASSRRRADERMDRRPVSVVRFAFRLYLFIHFVSLGPWAARSCSLATGSLPADVEPLRAGLPELPLLLGRARARDSLRLRRRRTRGAVCARLARPVGCRGVWYVAACLFGETR
jgi:hypothetical protein